MVGSSGCSWLVPFGKLVLKRVDDVLAGFLGRLAGRVDHAGSQGNHEWRSGSLAVSLIAFCQVFRDTFGFPSLGAFGEVGVQIEFKFRFGKYIAANITTFHDQIAELNTVALLLLHPVAHFGDGGHMRYGGAGFGRADFFFRVIAIHHQEDVSIQAHQLGFPFFAKLSNRFGIVDVDARLQAVPGECSIHGTGVDISVSQFAGDQFGIGAFAAGAGAVDGDYDGLVIVHGFGLRQSDVRDSATFRSRRHVSPYPARPGQEKLTFERNLAKFFSHKLGF